MDWPPAMSSSFSLTTPALVASVVLLGGSTPAAKAQLHDAFVAVWGHDQTPIWKTVTGPGFPERLGISPERLEPLGHGRFALITREVNTDAAHGMPGAVTVSYLDHGPQGWRLIRTWNEVASGGSYGGSDMSIKVRRDLGPDPLLIVGGLMIEVGGFDEDNSQVLKLAKDGVVDLGRVPLEADDSGSGDLNIASYRYQGRIHAGSGKALFAVTYDGWTAPRRAPDEDGPRKAFHKEVAVVVRDGCIAPAKPLRLPDKAWNGPKGPHCQLFAS